MDRWRKHWIRRNSKNKSMICMMLSSYERLFIKLALQSLNFLPSSDTLRPPFGLWFSLFFRVLTLSCFLFSCPSTHFLAHKGCIFFECCFSSTTDCILLLDLTEKYVLQLWPWVPFFIFYDRRWGHLGRRSLHIPCLLLLWIWVWRYWLIDLW